MIVMLFTGCIDDNKISKSSDKKEFINNVDQIISIVLTNKYDKKSFTNDYKYYSLSNGNLIGNNYNIKTNNYEYNLKHDVSEMDMEYILIIENKIGELYLSIKNDDYCAVKNFKDEKFNVFNINDYEKCNIDVFYGDEVFVSIFGMDIEKNNNYVSGTLSNTAIQLLASTNILDTTYCSYRWFRDGIEIKNSNVSKYVINNDENAYYSVEVTTVDGKKVKSEPINVIIKK